MLAIFSLGGGEIVMILAMLFLLPLALAAFAFWIWMLVHAIRNDSLTEGQKIAWVLVILFLHFLGAIIYFFAGRQSRPPAMAA